MIEDNDIDVLVRTKEPKAERARAALEDPLFIQREINNRSLYEFIQFFWPVISNDEFKPNWHIKILCKELEEIAYRVANRLDKKHDLIINIPPGTTKTITCSIMFPVWCWTKWHWLRFITASYSGALALESAEYSRDLIKNDLFKLVYPELMVKDDKDTKSNYKLIKQCWNSGMNRVPSVQIGGNRYSTSVGGTLTGFHGHILIVDDPLNPHQSISDTERATANRWVDQTLSTRKTDKKVSTTITVMQRLHQDDPSGHMLAKKKENLRHICLPGEIVNYGDLVNPPELAQYYVNGLLDPERLDWKVLKDLEADIGQYGYAGQIGQRPTPPGGGMFKADNFNIIDDVAEVNVLRRVRYWDKAGSSGKGAFTVGVKMALLSSGKFIVEDVVRGQWGSGERERIIRQTAEADGDMVHVFIEQEPGSGGKESAENTIRNLAGYHCEADRPTGNKSLRADPLSVQVNNGNVWLRRGDWNGTYKEEFRHFPFGTYKDQVDASSGAFAHLKKKKEVKILRRGR